MLCYAEMKKLDLSSHVIRFNQLECFFLLTMIMLSQKIHQLIQISK